MMTYKVIALSVGGKSNRIFTAGDVVTADAFPDGHAEKLVEQGFLQVVDGDKMIAHTVTEEDVENNPDAGLVPGEEIQYPDPFVEQAPLPTAASPIQENSAGASVLLSKAQTAAGTRRGKK